MTPLVLHTGSGGFGVRPGGATAAAALPARAARAVRRAARVANPGRAGRFVRPWHRNTWSPNGSETVTFQYIELWTANKMITVASFRTAGARASRGCRGPLGVKIIRPIELFRVS